MEVAAVSRVWSLLSVWGWREAIIVAFAAGAMVGIGWPRLVEATQDRWRRVRDWWRPRPATDRSAMRRHQDWAECRSLTTLRLLRPLVRRWGSPLRARAIEDEIGHRTGFLAQASVVEVIGGAHPKRVRRVIRGPIVRHRRLRQIEEDAR